MKDWPNYEIYHVHELEKALTNINESEKPDEAAHIRKLLKKGGYENTEENIQITKEDTAKAKKAAMKGADPKHILFRVIFILGAFLFAYSQFKTGENMNSAYIFFAIGLLWTASTTIHFFIAKKAMVTETASTKI